MTSAYRSQSPILKASSKRKSLEMLLEEGKIHRIRIISDAFCTVANVVSPNCIWFKLRNCISDQLRCIKPSPLEKWSVSAEGVEKDLYKYVMAPIQENVYARARIIDFKIIRKHEHLIKVHFIDEGYAEWMNEQCLAKMEKVLFTHPWQAFPVALFKMSPGLDLTSLAENNNWCEDATQLLINIIAEYSFFRISPIQTSDRHNNYYEYNRADVFGLASEDDKLGESIGHRLAIEMFSIPRNQVTRIDYFHRSWFDAKQQPLLCSLDENYTEEIVNSMPIWRRRFPEEFSAEVARQIAFSAGPKPGDDGEKNDELSAAELHAEWDPDCPVNAYPKINSLTSHYLAKKKYFEDNKLMLCIEYVSAKSPYEFYAFPLLRGETDPIERFFDDQLKWASTLDSFYGHLSNRKPIDCQNVMRMLRDESHPQVYAIYEFNDEVTVGSYRRVHVLAVRNPKAVDYSEEFCRIRFLDVGGNDIVPLAGLIAIHSRHCKKPPMCLQLSLSGIAPTSESDSSSSTMTFWSEQSCRAFRKLARNDMPVECEFVRQAPSNIRNIYSDPPQCWPDVFEVCNLRVNGVEKSVENDMISHKHATLVSRS